jgi:hypothetical protein
MQSVLTDVFRDAFTTDATTTSFTAKVPTTTKPSGSGVVDMYSTTDPRRARPYLANYIQIVPYGTTTNDTTFDLRIWAWNRNSDSTAIWIPQILYQASCTLCSASGAALATSGLMVDTITAVISGTDVTKLEHGTPNNTPSSVMLWTRGAEILEFDIDLTGAVSANVLYRLLDLVS